MKFTRQDSPSNSITTYTSTGFVINGEPCTGNVLLNATQLISPWTDKDLAALTADDLLAPLPTKPDLLVIGCGARQLFPSAELYASFYAAGVGIEVMTTDAACRTFNVLMSEGRDAAAALLINS